MLELNAKKVTQVAPGVIDGVDGAVFSVEGTDGGTFAIASKRKELKQLMRSDADVIYDTKNSKLFLNENGTKQGWGKRKIGGLIGRLKGKPQLSSEHFEGLTAHNDAGTGNPALLTTGVIRHRPFDPIRFLSMSGGGWNTHSNLAGVFAASMDWQKTNNKSRDIADLLSKYNYISANSGGTWFLSHLGFSPDYVDSLTNEDRANNYTTNGFIGNVEKAFGEIDIPLVHQTSSYLARNYIANNANTFNANWPKLVKKLVYDPIMKGLTGRERDNNNISTKKFEGKNLAEWATGKHLTYASALTKRSQMAPKAQGNYVAPAIRVPLAKLSKDGLILNANYAYGSYVGPYRESTFITNNTNFHPLSIEIKKSDSNASDDSAWYRILGYNLNYNEAIFEYDNDFQKKGFNESSVGRTMSMEKAEGGASFNTATAPSIASSSALAFMAIPQFWPGIFNRAIAYKHNAPIAYIRDGQLVIGKEFDPSVNNYDLQKNYKDISRSSAYTRLGDGGFADNTSLAYNLSAAIRQAYSKENLQWGNLLSDRKEKQLIRFTRPEDGFDKFEATLFHNNTEALSDLSTVNDQKIPNDLLSLFAADSYTRASDQSELGYTRSNWLENPRNLLKNTEMESWISSGIWQISPQIFSTDSLTGMTIEKNDSVTITTGLSEPHWEFKSEPKAGSQGVHLQFWRLPVRTVNNEIYGIKEGVGGYLNLFLSLNPESNAMPYKNAIHKEYAENYDAWRQAMSSFNDKYNTNFLQVEHGSF